METDTKAKAKPAELNALIRCDSGCGAQAWTVFRNAKDHDLSFCAHHTIKYEVGMRMQGFELVRDDRDKINAKPSPSANAA